MRRLSPKAMAVALALLTTTGSAIDIYVATNGNNGGGTNWSTAYTNVFDALSMATNGDNLYLAGSNTFYLTNQLAWANNTNVTIRGGYAATNDADLPGLYDAARWPTVLTRSSSITNRILNVSGVISGTLERVTISGGYRNPSGSDSGGGVYISGSTGLIFSACTVYNNRIVNATPASGTGYGGGIYSINSVVILSNCLVQANSNSGGNSSGGGIYFSGGSLTLVDSILANNLCASLYTQRGGGLFHNGGVCVFRNCLAAGNALADSQDMNGHCIYMNAAAATQRFENCTVVFNGGQGISRAAGVVSATNCIVWGNGDDIVGSVSLGYSDIGDGDNSGTNGCISADPLFERGFYLASNSPAVGAGSNLVNVLYLTNYTVRTDGALDTNASVSLGYHYPAGYDFSYGDLYVAANGDDGNSGTNADDPFRTVTRALTQAQNGTWVHVGAGHYTNGLETFPWTKSNLMGLQILGTNRAATVFSAAGSASRILIFTRCNNLRVEKATLANANWTGSYGISGAGIYLNNCAGAVFADCAITNNYMLTDTPASSSPCYGGGMYSYAGVVTLSNCLVKSNTNRGGNGYGAGLALLYGIMWVYDSILADNHCIAYYTKAGGALANRGGMCWLRNCLVVKNEASESGAGLYNYNATMPGFIVEDCTVANNAGEGLYGYSGTIVRNSIFWGNSNDVYGSIALSYSDIKDGDPGPGCISADPAFANTNAADYSLTYASPCWNAGTNQPWMAGARDLAGYRRIINSRVDMGAYEIWQVKGAMFGMH